MIVTPTPGLTPTFGDTWFGQMEQPNVSMMEACSIRLELAERGAASMRGVSPPVLD